LKNIISMLVFTLLLVSLIACGDDKKEAAEESVGQDSVTVTELEPNPGQLENPKMTEDNPYMKQVPAPIPTPDFPRGTEYTKDELVAGTCEYAAFWFAEYFTSGDTIHALALCNDSMKTIVRAILTPKKIEDLQRNRNAGYSLTSASLLDSPNKDVDGIICLKATFYDETREDCNFIFHKYGNDWLLTGFGE
jgi:hypothetical protein